MELDQHRDTIASNLKPVQKYLYSSPYSGQKLFALATKYSLNEKYYDFAITVGDIVLGFYKVEDTVPLLQQELGVDPKTAALLGAEVLEFLAPLSDPNWHSPFVDDVEETALMDSSNVTGKPEQNRIPLKSPALINTPVVAESVVIEQSQVVEPTPVYQPAPAGYMSTPTPAPTPVYQSSQPVTTPAPAPLSAIPSYTPTPTPPAPATPAPAPDRPKWSTEI